MKRMAETLDVVADHEMQGQRTHLRIRMVHKVVHCAYPARKGRPLRVDARNIHGERFGGKFHRTEVGQGKSLRPVSQLLERAEHDPRIRMRKRGHEHALGGFPLGRC